MCVIIAQLKDTGHAYLLSQFIHSEDVGLIKHDMVRRAAHACDMCSVGEHLDMCVDAACNRTPATNKIVLAVYAGLRVFRSGLHIAYPHANCCEAEDHRKSCCSHRWPGASRLQLRFSDLQ